MMLLLLQALWGAEFLRPVAKPCIFSRASASLLRQLPGCAHHNRWGFGPELSMECDTWAL